jgi:ABC-type amino acid transport system permease subunit
MAGDGFRRAMAGGDMIDGGPLGLINAIARYSWLAWYRIRTSGTAVKLLQNTPLLLQRFALQQFGATH